MAGRGCPSKGRSKGNPMSARGRKKRMKGPYGRKNRTTTASGTKKNAKKAGSASAKPYSKKMKR